MRRSLSSLSSSSSSRTEGGGSSSSSHSSGNGRVRRRPFSPSSSSPSSFLSSRFSSLPFGSPASSSSSSSTTSPCNVGSVLTLGLDADTLRSVLCDVVPRCCRSCPNGNDGDGQEVLAMLEGLFAELDAATKPTASASSAHPHAVDQLLGNVDDVLTCFLDSSCGAAVPTVAVFHVHSIVGQIRDLVLGHPDGALRAYTKALWVASWSREIPSACLARTLHRIGALKASQQQYEESRRLLKQAVATYASSGTAPDHPVVADCQQLLREVDAAYWTKVGANEDSWSSLAGLSDRRAPLPRIREEHPESIVVDSVAAAAAGYYHVRDNSSGAA